VSGTLEETTLDPQNFAQETRPKREMEEKRDKALPGQTQTDPGG